MSIEDLWAGHPDDEEGPRAEPAQRRFQALELRRRPPVQMQQAL